MAVIGMLTEEECYLVAILTDSSGLDLAEFGWYEPENDDGCWRARPYQWSWWRDEHPMQIDQAARDVGKSLGIQARACAFPFAHRGQEMVVTAPELVHQELVTQAIERRVFDMRLTYEMLPKVRSRLTRRPFRMNFTTGARIVGRIPQVTGRGVKGVHPVKLELDEAQDYPDAGWTELTATLRRGIKGAIWRAHGVTRGIRDKFFEFTQPSPENPWKVHRITAMHRPDWDDAERQRNIVLYGSREHPDYRRNILGLHGDATNALFVVHRLMRCVDSVEASDYNTDEYQYFRVTAERLEELAGEGSTQEEQAAAAVQLLEFSELHARYSIFWCGQDVGFTVDPSEILIASEYVPDAAERRADRAAHRASPDKDATRLRLLARIHLERISNPVQAEIIRHVIRHYKPRAYGIDKMQPVSEPVLTPGGWAPIGTLQVGDQVIGSDGKPTMVLGVFPQEDRRVMRVTCTDGSWTRCGPEHLWTVKHTQHKESKVLTTEQLAAILKRGGPRQWTLPMLSQPAETRAGDLPIDPYLLGALLGDGNMRKHSTRFSSLDDEVVAEVEARLPPGHVLKHTDRCNYYVHATGSLGFRTPEGRFAPCNSLLGALKTLGLAGKRSHEKRVPAMYLTAAPAERLLLLQGIMDTDGWVSVQRGSAHIGIRSSSEGLIQDVIALVESLGGSGRYRCHATSCNGKAGRPAYRAALALPRGVVPFRLSRKRDMVKDRALLRRYIARVEPDGDENSVCIRVAAQDELYVTRHHLLTHNTGNGIGLFQDVQATDPEIAAVIRGYGFSESVIVDIDGTVQVEEQEDVLKEAAITSNVLEYSTDQLRALVDDSRLALPWDRDLLRQFQGQTWKWSNAMIGKDERKRRRVFSAGNFHILDGARMLAMAHAQAPIEAIVENLKHPVHESVMDQFLTY